MSVTESLERLVNEVAELEEHIRHLEHEDESRVDPETEWEAEQFGHLVDKLADFKRGIATIDEVFDEAGL